MTIWRMADGTQALQLAGEGGAQFRARLEHGRVLQLDLEQQRIGLHGNGAKQRLKQARRGARRQTQRLTGAEHLLSREFSVTGNARHGRGELGQGGPAPLAAVAGGFVDPIRQQIIVRRQPEAVRLHQHAQVLQVAVAIADRQAEHQPREHAHARGGRRTASVHDLAQGFEVPARVLEHPGQIQHLTAIDRVQALPFARLQSAVEALDQVDRARNIAPGHRRHLQPHPRSKRHHEPLVDDGVRIVVHALVIRFQEMRGRRMAGRLEQRALLEHHRQLVLRTGQRHLLGGVMAERHRWQGLDTCLKHIVGQRHEHLVRVGHAARRQQRQRAGRFRTVVVQQGESILRSPDTGILSQQDARALFGQQVVEIGLDRPVRTAIDNGIRPQRQVRTQREAGRMGQPRGRILE